MVHGLKGFHKLRRPFPFLQTRLPTLGSRRHYAGPLGSMSTAMMRKYIAKQKGR
jgi:hypothetical protein